MTLLNITMSFSRSVIDQTLQQHTFYPNSDMHECRTLQVDRWIYRKVQLIYSHVQQAIRDYKYNTTGLLVSTQHHPVEDLYETGAATKKACNVGYTYRLLMLLIIPGLSLCNFPIVLIIKYKFWSINSNKTQIISKLIRILCKSNIINIGQESHEKDMRIY